MLRIFTTALVLLFHVPTWAQSCEKQLSPIRVATYNLLTTVAPHAWFFPSWSERSAGIAVWMREQKIDVLATQEGIRSMLEVLQRDLPEYEAIGLPRDESWFFAERTSLFFNSERFELVQDGEFWLSQTPDTPGSKGWDAMNVRSVTWAELRQRSTGESLFVFSAHFDHMGEQARRESARLVLERVRLIAGGKRSVVLGDLNTTHGDAALARLRSELQDTREQSVTAPVGAEATYWFGWRLDYIFSTRDWSVCSHKIHNPLTLDGRSTSDHSAVVSDLSLTPCP